MRDILNYEDYLKSCSLKTVAGTVINEIKESIAGSNNGREFLIGLHVRHFLDATSPTYVAAYSNEGFQADIDRIIKKNKDLGKHTFNHLIDALFYQKRETNHKPINQNTFIHIQISFKDASTQTNVRTDPDFTEIINAEVSLSKYAFEELSANERFYELLPAINKFCKDVGLDNNMVNLTAIYNAIDQLHSFKKFGEIIDVIVLRPRFEIGYVLGLTVIRNDQELDIESAFCQLSSHYKFLNYNTSFAGNKLTKERNDGSGALYQIEKYRGFRYHDPQPIPAEIIKAIVKEITHTASDAGGSPFDLLKNIHSTNKDEFERNPLFITVKSFLSMLYEFCDEQVEGKKITYGFVLGNPGLFDFLKGRNVLPGITDGSTNQFLELDGYRKNFHLFSNHLETALVVPYSEASIEDDNSKFPFFFMKVKNFEEDIFNWAYGALIPSQYRPYAYLSYRFPWAVSAVVGPGSQIRIFSSGRIIAFKDGKGWKVYGESSNQLKGFGCWSSENEKNRIEQFLDIVCLLSPIYNSESHGGLVVYSHDLPSDVGKLEEFIDHIKPLANQEPHWQENCEWLKGRNLFTEKGDINYEVAQRLIQISVLDGATVFLNEHYGVKDFGTRLDFDGSQSIRNYGGSKTKSAQNFVEWCDANNMKRSFAIAISADGPLKIFHSESTCDGELVPLYIYNKVKKN